MEELTVTAGTSFTSRITAPALVPVPAGMERLRHPDAGELRLAYESLELPDADDQRLIVYLPADAATSAALDRWTRWGASVPDAQVVGSQTRMVAGPRSAQEW